MPVHRVPSAFVALYRRVADRWEFVESCALALAARMCRRDRTLAAFDIKDDPNALAWSCAR